MRILMVSKFRTFQGGVEAHVEYLASLLRGAGHVVELFASEDVDGPVFSADDAHSNRLASARLLLWNGSARRQFRGVAKRFRPDVIHFHSIYHQLSPSVLGAAAGVPAVMTLHDYKLAAPCYTLERDGQICTLCVGRRMALPSIRYRCINSSWAGSALCAGEQLAFQKRYVRQTSRMIVPSRFSADLMTVAGVPADQLRIVPWAVDVDGRSPNRTAPRRPQVLFAGRLHPTKGVQLLLDAWSDAKPAADLTIAGDGILRETVEQACRADPTVRYMGSLARDELSEVMKASDLAVCPSLFPETFGLSAVESLVSGLPLVSSGRGALAELAGPGVLTVSEPNDRRAWGAALSVATGGAKLAELRAGLALRDLTAYRSSAMLASIEKVYAEATPSNLGVAKSAGP